MYDFSFLVELQHVTKASRIGITIVLKDGSSKRVALSFTLMKDRCRWNVLQTWNDVAVYHNVRILVLGETLARHQGQENQHYERSEGRKLKKGGSFFDSDER